MEINDKHFVALSTYFGFKIVMIQWLDNHVSNKTFIWHNYEYGVNHYVGGLMKLLIAINNYFIRSSSIRRDQFWTVHRFHASFSNQTGTRKDVTLAYYRRC